MSLRLLHCIYDDPANPWVAGGGAVRAFEIYRRISDRLDVTVLTGRYPGARDEEAYGIHYRRAGVSRPYALSRLSYAREATRRLRQGDYDVGIYDFSVYAPVPIPRWPAPVGLVMYHLTGPTAAGRWGPEIGGIIARVERALLRRAHWISTASQWTVDQLRPIVPADTHMVVVGAGVDEQLFRVDRSEEGYLLYFGRLDLYHKGLDTLLQAMALLVRDRPTVELRIAGRGKDAERVAAMVGELGLGSNVKLLGPVSDAERLRLFGAAQFLVMPSRFEGFGIVAAEAQAAALPVVAAAAASLPEVVGPEGGVLVPPQDPAALAEAMRALLDDAARRRTLSEGARRVARQYSWDAVAERHLDYVQRIAAEAARDGWMGGQRGGP